MTHAVPHAAGVEVPERRRTWMLLWAGVALLVLGPGVGLLGTLFGVLESISRANERRHLFANQVAFGIDISITPLIAGLLVGVAGLMLAGVALVRIVRMSRRPA